ncbi:MAG: hypothetical protein IPO92_15780 [Saprospiraceae bacterium]|nr:hypothetical protein [Saprospiraceae bacterium]
MKEFKHTFTPVDVSILAARYLATNEDSKILDIGSGAGKFCLIGSACSEGTFTGVEQTKEILCNCGWYCHKI